MGMHCGCFVFVCLLFGVVGQYTEGDSCATKIPLCINTVVQIPATTSLSSPTPYDCITYGAVRPVWTYVRVVQQGLVSLQLLVSPSREDIDFVVWGPLDTPHSCGGALSRVAKCSISSTNSTLEFFADSGDVNKYFVILFTNPGPASNVSFSVQRGSAHNAAIDCNIVSFDIRSGALYPASRATIVTASGRLVRSPEDTLAVIRANEDCALATQDPARVLARAPLARLWLDSVARAAEMDLSGLTDFLPFQYQFCFKPANNLFTNLLASKFTVISFSTPSASIALSSIVDNTVQIGLEGSVLQNRADNLLTLLPLHRSCVLSSTTDVQIIKIPPAATPTQVVGFRKPTVAGKYHICALLPSTGQQHWSDGMSTVISFEEQFTLLYPKIAAQSTALKLWLVGQIFQQSNATSGNVYIVGQGTSCTSGRQNHIGSGPATRLTSVEVIGLFAQIGSHIGNAGNSQTTVFTTTLDFSNLSPKIYTLCAILNNQVNDNWKTNIEVVAFNSNTAVGAVAQQSMFTFGGALVQSPLDTVMLIDNNAFCSAQHTSSPSATNSGSNNSPNMIVQTGIATHIIPTTFQRVASYKWCLKTLLPPYNTFTDGLEVFVRAQGAFFNIQPAQYSQTNRAKIEIRSNLLINDGRDIVTLINSQQNCVREGFSNPYGLTSLVRHIGARQVVIFNTTLLSVSTQYRLCLKPTGKSNFIEESALLSIVDFKLTPWMVSPQLTTMHLTSLTPKTYSSQVSVIRYHESCSVVGGTSEALISDRPISVTNNVELVFLLDLSRLSNQPNIVGSEFLVCMRDITGNRNYVDSLAFNLLMVDTFTLQQSVYTRNTFAPVTFLGTSITAGIDRIEIIRGSGGCSSLPDTNISLMSLTTGLSNNNMRLDFSSFSGLYTACLKPSSSSTFEDSNSATFTVMDIFLSPSGSVEGGINQLSFSGNYANNNKIQEIVLLPVHQLCNNFAHFQARIAVVDNTLKLDTRMVVPGLYNVCFRNTLGEWTETHFLTLRVRSGFHAQSAVTRDTNVPVKFYGNAVNAVPNVLDTVAIIKSDQLCNQQTGSAGAQPIQVGSNTAIIDMSMFSGNSPLVICHSVSGGRYVNDIYTTVHLYDVALENNVVFNSGSGALRFRGNAITESTTVAIIQLQQQGSQPQTDCGKLRQSNDGILFGKKLAVHKVNTNLWTLSNIDVMAFAPSVYHVCYKLGDTVDFTSGFYSVLTVKQLPEVPSYFPNVVPIHARNIITLNGYLMDAEDRIVFTDTSSECTNQEAPQQQATAKLTLQQSVSHSAQFLSVHSGRQLTYSVAFTDVGSFKLCYYSQNHMKWVHLPPLMRVTGGIVGFSGETGLSVSSGSAPNTIHLQTRDVNSETDVVGVVNGPYTGQQCPSDSYVSGPSPVADTIQSQFSQPGIYSICYGTSSTHPLTAVGAFQVVPQACLDAIAPTAPGRVSIPTPSTIPDDDVLCAWLWIWPLFFVPIIVLFVIGCIVQCRQASKLQATANREGIPLNASGHSDADDSQATSKLRKMENILEKYEQQFQAINDQKARDGTGVKIERVQIPFDRYIENTIVKEIEKPVPVEKIVEVPVPFPQIVEKEVLRVEKDRWDRPVEDPSVKMKLEWAYEDMERLKQEVEYLRSERNSGVPFNMSNGSLSPDQFAMRASETKHLRAQLEQADEVLRLLAAEMHTQAAYSSPHPSSPISIHSGQPTFFY